MQRVLTAAEQQPVKRSIQIHAKQSSFSPPIPCKQEHLSQTQRGGGRTHHELLPTRTYIPGSPAACLAFFLVCIKHASSIIISIFAGTFPCRVGCFVSKPNYIIGSGSALPLSVCVSVLSLSLSSLRYLCLSSATIFIPDTVDKPILFLAWPGS